MRNDQLTRRLYEQCVDQHSSSMYRVALRLTGTRDAAIDLVQETYLQAWRGLPKLKDSSKLKSWMFAILRNQFSKSVRRRVVRSTSGEWPLDPVDGGSHSDCLDRKDLVQFAVDQLEESHKLPVLLVTMESLTVEEAAEVLGWRRGTVLSRLHRGKQKLKRILERQLGTEVTGAEVQWTGSEEPR